MAANKTSQPETGSKTWRNLALAMAGLLFLLLISFHEGLGPNMVHFNNDAPFGMIKAREDSAVAGLTGYWENLNWIGIEQPSGQPEVGNLYYFLTGPEIFCKTFPAFSLFFLGFCGWVLFRTLRFHPAVCFAGALAAAYNTNAFSNACWGLGTWPIARGMILLSLAALFSYRERPHWSKLVLAGAAVGFNIMGAFDTGAIYSLYVAAFALALALSKPGEPLPKRTGKGVLQVGVVAICAFLLSAHTVMNLIGTQVKGVSGMAQTEQEKKDRWSQATLWSFPKAESFRLVIPGLFGYRMAEQQNPKPTDYWGTVGAPDEAPYARYSGSGEYIGLFVILMALWALGQSFRGDRKDLGGQDRFVIWFCGLAGLIALLLAFGRFAPFYKLVYALPYFSTIRNPIKFTNPLHVSILILFGYGLNNLVRGYLLTGTGEKRSWTEAWKALKKLTDAHARRLVYGGFALLAVCGLGALIYASSSAELVNHLEKTARFAPESAKMVSSHSVQEVFIALLLLAAFLLIAWGGMTNWLKPKLALGLLIGLFALDMARANSPWVNFYDYKYRYDSNHVIDFLKSQCPPWRNTAEVAPLTRRYLLAPGAENLGGIFNNWLQQHFQYNGIHSLDISQMPRVPVMEQNYFMNFRPSRADGQDIYKVARLWELTSTRYILGHDGYLPMLNEQFDRGKNRFSARERFQFAAKPGVTNVGANDITTLPSANGPMAVFEFSGALPRASIFTQWQSGLSNHITYTNEGVVLTNEAALPLLASPTFDPSAEVLVAESIPAPAATGTSDGRANNVRDLAITSRSVSMNVEVTQEAVLLLNDRHSPNWHVYVDGQERPLLRANYLVRAVQLKPGDKQVVFRFEPTAKYLQVTFVSIAASLALLVWWPIRERKPTSDSQKAATSK